MRAVVKVGRQSGENGTEIRDVPRPTVGDGEVLIRVAATGICGTDNHIYRWDPSIRQSVQPPRIYGHEFCGFVETIGRSPSPSSIQVGDYVSAEAHWTCGECNQCRAGDKHLCIRTRILGLHEDGAFAEFVKVPAETVIRLPVTLPPRVGAFLDAFGTAVQITEMVNLLGQSVLIAGLGPIGAMMAVIADAAGARRIVVTNPEAEMFPASLEWARKAGIRAFHPIDVYGRDLAEIRHFLSIAEPNGIDVAIDMSGSEAGINLCLEAVRMGGDVLALGLPAGHSVTIHDYTRNIIFKGIRFRGVIGRRIFSTWDRMFGLLSHGLDVEWIAQSLQNSLESFHDAMSIFERREALKVVIFPEGEEAAMKRLTAVTD
jgi:threonine 3-dehydrogenase